MEARLSLFARLLKEFHKKYADAPEKIRAAIADNRLDELKAYLHQIKGVAGNLSAADLLAVTTDFETAVKADRQEELSGFLSEFTTIFDQTMDSILRLANGTVPDDTQFIPPNIQAGDTGRAEMEMIVKKLSGMLESKDMDAEDVVASVHPDVAALKISDEWDELKQQVNELDFNSASKSLNKIAALLNITVDGDQ